MEFVLDLLLQLVCAVCYILRVILSLSRPPYLGGVVAYVRVVSELTFFFVLPHNSFRIVFCNIFEVT